RDFHVTGVQTCALPIYIAKTGNHALIEQRRLDGRLLAGEGIGQHLGGKFIAQRLGAEPGEIGRALYIIIEVDKAESAGVGIDEKIGRASWRERREIGGA